MRNYRHITASTNKRNVTTDGLVFAYRQVYKDDKNSFINNIQFYDMRAVEELLKADKDLDMARIAARKLGTLYPNVTTQVLCILVSSQYTEDDDELIRLLADIPDKAKKVAFRCAICSCKEEYVKLLCPEKVSLKDLKIAVETGEITMVSLLIKRGYYSKRQLSKAVKKAKKLGHTEMAKSIEVAKKTIH